MKTIEKIFEPGVPHYVGDGFRVHNFIPNNYPSLQERMDPFVMLDYNSRYEFAPSKKIRGVGAHPHSGFETVTIAYKGAVAHHDSAGNSGVIHEGDVQWMTAGSGVLHKEHHEENFSKTGGPFEMVQVWVNLPARFKKVAPKYQALVKENMGRYFLPDDSGVVEVIAGSYLGVNGPGTTFTPIHLYNARLKNGKKAEFTFPEHYNTALLVIEGNVIVNDGQEIGKDHFAIFRNDGETFSVEAGDDSVVLILSGEPFHEPIVQHGPFVMNSTEEIYAAIRDYNLGKYGFLDED